MTDALNLDLDFDFRPAPGCHDSGAVSPESVLAMIRSAVVIVQSAFDAHGVPVTLDAELYKSGRGLVYINCPTGLRLISVRFSKDTGRVTVEGTELDLRKPVGMEMLAEIMGAKVLAALKPV